MFLCVMRIPPALDGHGGSQRAWRLVEALRRHGPVHFVLVCRKADKDAASVSLEPLRPLVRSVTTIDIPEWNPTRRSDIPGLHRINNGWGDLLKFRSHEAPVIPAAALARIAAQLPVREADTVFAGRLPSAVFMQDLMDAGHLKARRRIVDFDDIMSRFRERQRRFDGKSLGRQGVLIARIDTVLIRRAERRIAAAWDGVSVCTAEDADALRETYPGAHAVRVPNVIERPSLPPRADDGVVRLLFVGNLSFFPNLQGLQLFVTQALPLVREAAPNVTLTVVGMLPVPEVRALCAEHGLALHTDVPSVAPYYADSDIVLAPILFGSGTRIKILESMAYGRAVVSTSLGAEGLDLVHGQHLLMADSMTAFAQAVIALAHNRPRRLSLAAAARQFVVDEYGVAALDAGIDRLLAGAGEQPAVPAGLPPGAAAHAGRPLEDAAAAGQ